MLLLRVPIAGQHCPQGGSVAALSYFSSSSILLYSFQTVRHAPPFLATSKKSCKFLSMDPERRRRAHGHFCLNDPST